MKILFADDEVHLQEIMRLELERMGHSVVVCPDGLTAVAALGFESWSRLEYMAHDLSRVGNDFSRLAPQVQAVRGEVVSLTSGMAQTNSAVGSLREDVSGMRSDLGSIREVVERLPKERTAVQSAASDKRGPSYNVPRNATTMANPYRGMRPRMPW